MDRIFKLKSFDGKSQNEVNVRVNVTDDKLNVFYHLTGNLSNVIIQKRSSNPVRVYDLWEHTCFELFLKKKDGPWYIEFNFATSGDWNSFFISSYRKNDGELNKIKWQEVKSNQLGNELILESSILFAEMDMISAKDFKDGNIEVGVTSVIELSNKELEYFAICHPGAEPDFHKGFIDFSQTK